MTSNEVCPVCCEGLLVKFDKTVLLNLASSPTHVAQHGHACDVCGTEIATGEDLRFNARSAKFAELKASGRMTGEDIKALRLKLQVSQEVASQIFGGGPVAFCKYEKHDLAPTDAMDNLLWLAGKYPVIVDALARRHSVKLPFAESSSSAPKVSIDMINYEPSNWDAIMQTAKMLLEGGIAAAEKSKGYKKWAHAAVKMEVSPLASNEISVNFDTAIAA